MARSKKTNKYWKKEQVSHLTDSQWGDTGKGKLVDLGAQAADIVIKTNGGANAGHTVVNEQGSFKLHLIPAGFANPQTLSIVGTGCVVDPLQLVTEYKDIASRIAHPAKLLLSDKAHMVMPWHRILDGLVEKARGGKAIGTTGRGIGIAYSDRARRTGFRVGDLLRKEFVKEFKLEYARQERLMRLLDGERLVSELGDESSAALKKHIQQARKQVYADLDDLVLKMREAVEVLSPLIGNTYEVIRRAYDKGEIILGEAGQGALLDLDFGGYPYVTSSHPGVIGFMISTGLQAKEIGRVIGSTKAYSTRVGNGPMPTELTDEVGKHIQERGGEVGVTTGRSRRCGWFDVVATQYGAQTAGITELALTKLDVLDDFPLIKVCVGYEVEGKKYRYLPNSDLEFMAKAKPIYKEFPGWLKDTSGIRVYSDLPAKARRYVEFLEEKVGLPISLISISPERDAIIYKD